MIYTFGNWPFPKDAPAHLLWVKSPTHIVNDAQEKQWQSKLLFYGEDGSYYVRNMPWGYLPEMRLGRIYTNGSLSDTSVKGTIRNIKLGSSTRMRKISAADIQAPWTDMVRNHQPSMLYEQCVEVRDGSTVLFIPCIEVARSFFGINKQLAYLLLEPGGLTRCCRTAMGNGRVHIEFNNEMPLNSLNQTVVNRIATILHNDRWADCWRQVWHGSSQKTVPYKKGQQSLYLQLLCFPPICDYSTWIVRGEDTTAGFLVLEIIGVNTSKKLPFYNVSYSHPRLKVTGEILPPTGKMRVPSAGDNCSELEIDESLDGPKDSGSPLQSEINVASILFANTPKINRLLNDERKADITPREHEPVRPVPSSEDQVKISLNDEAANGQIRAGDFLPLENLIGVPPGLTHFIDAVKVMVKRKTFVSCALKPVPVNSRLVRVGKCPRQFALVQVRYKNLCGYLLEVDQSDGDFMSTMVFAMDSNRSAADVSNELLTSYITSSGHWDLKLLADNHAYRFDIAKHTSLEATRWANRLLAKIIGLSAHAGHG